MAGSIRERLTTAAAHLRQMGDDESAKADRLHEAGESASAEKARLRAESAYDSAAAVDAVLAPRGYMHLQERRNSASNMALTMNEELNRALRAEALEFGVILSDLAEEAFRKVLDGEWVPPKKTRARVRSGTKKVLNVRVDDELRQTVRQMLPQLNEDAGYRITESQIALSYMCEELGIERPEAANVDTIRLRLPQALAEHFRTESDRRGVRLQEIAEAGIQALLDGSWTLPRNEWLANPDARPKTTLPDGREVWASAGRSWSASERVWLPVQVNDSLLADLREKAEALSEEYGYLVHPGLVLRAILTDRLGVPAE
jgi:hypothetical protein